MYTTTVKIDGMMCGMCEAHVNDAIRAKLPVSSVKSSHGKGEAVLTSKLPITEAQLKEVLDPTGYYVLSVETVEGEGKKKRGLFGRRE